MTFNAHELNVCGVTLEEFNAMIELLRNTIGPCVTQKVEGRTQLDIAIINRICVCSTLVQELGNIKGFDSVAKAIRKVKNASPYEPQAQWFQLLVAYFIKAGGYEIKLEQPIDGSAPKDIILSAEKIMIECKCFEHSLNDRSAKRLDGFIKTGQIPTERKDQPEGFTTRTMLYPPPPGLPSAWVPTNHYLRVLSNGIKEKYSQLVDGWCNIIAFNTENISRNLHHVREPLESQIQFAKNLKLSGFLLIQQEAMTAEDYSARGQRFTVGIVERPAKNGVTIPHNFSSSVKQWNARRLGNSTNIR
jgi:hypothetical protein